MSGTCRLQLVTSLMALLDLLQDCSDKTDTVMMSQPCVVNFATVLLEQDCIRAVTTTF